MKSEKHDNTVIKEEASEVLVNMVNIASRHSINAATTSCVAKTVISCGLTLHKRF